MKVPHLNTLRTARTVLLPLLALSFSIALTAGLLAQPAPDTSGRLGQALALRASLRPMAAAKTFQNAGFPADLRRNADGRYVSHPNGMRAGAILRAHAAGPATTQVDEAVQTYDVFNPPPAFALAQGVSLTPTNLTPVWSSDETMLIFSSNRTATGTAGTRYHIWAIPVNGGTALQLTSSAGPAGGGEFFPALSADNNKQLAFTSDASSPGVQNLYTVPASASTVSVTSLKSPTIRGTDAGGNPLTGLMDVGRPAFSPADSSLLAFSALSVSGTNAGRRHLYFLYTATGGYNQSSISLPGKLTDGPADDTDPAFSQDGQYIAFASTASATAATGTPPSSDPNVSPIVTTAAAGTVSTSNRALFMITASAGLANGGHPVTAAGTGDNFGPAWSSAQADPYLNRSPGREYLAFARGASQTAPHDIYYLDVLQNTQAGGESGRSNEASSTPLNAVNSATPGILGAPVYQVNAGDPATGVTGPAAGGYVLDSFINPQTGAASFLVNGGTADAAPTTPINFNTAGDPFTPPGIYKTDRSGTFSYVFPNLTPLATYQVRLHLADPKDTQAGKRVFNVTVSDGNFGQITEPNIDIIALAQTAPGQADGLVFDAQTGAAVAATISLTQNPAAATGPTVFTSSTPSTPDPNGSAVPVNYNSPVTQGAYTATVTAPGYGTVTRQIVVSSSATSRTDFALPASAATASFSGQITDTTGNIISGVTLSVTDSATKVSVKTTGNTVSDGGGNYGPISLPPGTYLVTATSAAGSGFTTQTQTLTVVAGTPGVLPFKLSNTTSANVGSLGGLVTDPVTGAPVSGVVISVIDSNKTTVAVLTTGTQSSPAAPNGDGNPVNYFANLPTGTYSLQFSEPGYSPATRSVIVANTTTAPATKFVRADQALASTSAVVGPNTAVVVTYTVVVPTRDAFDKNGLVIAPRNAITVAFNPVSGDPPIVQGIEILSDPAPQFSGGFGSLVIGQTSSAAPQINAFGGTLTNTDGTQVTPVVPIITLDLSVQGTAVPSYYNVYRSPAYPNTVNSPTTSGPGTESAAVYQKYTPTPGKPLQFIDKGVDFSSQYYYQATAVYVQVLAPESASHVPIKLVTSDPGNLYDDVYPTWSPFRSVFSIAYSSNRTVTYNNPVNGTASETAISIGANSSLGNGGTVGAAYAGLLESQVVNLDPPTLVPYSGNEICHVNTGAGFSATSSTRTGVTPGQPATITVRLSSREAGIDDANVYLQIKDPDSKYQDANGLEHKVFAHDLDYRGQSNNPNAPFKLDSGSSDQLMNGGTNFGSRNSIRFFGGSYTGYNQFPGDGQVRFVEQRGSVGGIDGPESLTTTGGTSPGPAGNKSDTISIGRDGGGTNTNPVTTADGKPVLDANKFPVQLPGGDPAKFIPTGPEYECQVVKPLFAGADTTPADYTDPYWLAGVDDQTPFSGTAATRAPVTAQWLKMSRLPDAQQDGQGGILYSVTWKTPTSESDYYLDVIAFDKAIAPASYSTLGGSNWRIYDNVWGFSSQSSIKNEDILLVSDYTLGQKFAATTFGGRRGLLNLVPKLYGAESYVTGIDDSLLPNAIYRYAVFPGANPKAPQAEVLDIATSYNPADTPQGNGSIGTSTSVVPITPKNGLGVNSYYDRFIDDGRRVDGAPAVRSQLYSLWRTLARGPIPASVYAAYEPTLQSQPAVTDAGGAAPVSIAAGTVPVATRCIVWISPFTGDVLAGPGTLADPNTQANLRSFVAAGGRLCVSGQDVGSALTQGGTVNNGPGGFLSDVLGATLVSTNQGTHLPLGGNSPVNNRISYIPSYDGELQGGYQEVNTIFGLTTTALSARPIRISNNYGGNIFQSINFGLYVPSPDYSGNWRTDGSLDQLGPYIQGFPELANNTNSVVAQIDTIKPNVSPNVHTDITLQPFTNPIPPVDNGNDAAASGAGGVGLIYSENPITTSGGTGSKVVYATFGLEALSTEYYRQTNQFKPNPIGYFARNQRQNIMHNVVSYLRTGSISGTIRATSGNNSVGAGIPNATVYVQSAYGPVIPGRGTFSATTDTAGNFTIAGLEPGNYTLVAYKTGYSRSTSNAGTVLTVEGDSFVIGANLTLAQGSPGVITGIVKDAAGKTVFGASVTFTASDGGSVQTTTTDANGSYTLSNVPPGTYVGVASAGGASAASSPTTVASGATVNVPFTLAPGAGTATGRVVDVNGTPVSGATVFFNNGAPVVLKATTDKLGVYAFPTGGLPAGSYTVTAAAPGFGTSTPIQVVIAGATTTIVPDIALSAAANGTLGGLVTSSGTTAPVAGVTITIVNAATGQTITPVTSVATATAGADGASLNYGPVSLLQGTYTVTAIQGGVSSPSQTITVPANGFARADFTGGSGLQPLHVFAAGFQFVSTPADYRALGFDGLFGAKNTALAGTTPNGNRSSIAVWDPLTGAYALDPTAPADSLRPGVGYWVYLKSAVPVTQAGTTLTGAVQVPLNPAWNQIGVPSPAGVTVGSLTFTASNGTTYSFADASGSTYHLISGTLYSYDGSAYQPVGAGATLQPWQAYWIRVYTPVTVNIPTGR